jgi:beta-glucosidase
MTRRHITRRKLAAAAAVTSAELTATALALPAQGRTAVHSGPVPGFPEGFRWGTATSSYQVEGAVDVDGRGPSIWDTFADKAGKIADGSSGRGSVEHYRRYKEDVQLMKGLGAKTYRFSIAWPRVFPDGGKTPNPKGLAFYDRLVDELLANGIEPYATLYHWDLPQALQDRGGWESRDTAQAFGDYAGYVASKLTDRVKHVFTMNEMGAFVEMGYGIGVFAPGLKLPPGRLSQVRHHAVLGHGLGVQAIRAMGKSGTQVGVAENINIAVPAIETPENIAAAERATRELNAAYLTVILEGRYTKAYLRDAGADAPRFTAQDLKTIASPIDLVGLNVYTPSHYVQAADDPSGFTVLPFPKTYPRMAASSWLNIGPEALYWAPRHVATVWNVKNIFITENGTSAADQPADDGAIHDIDRVMYLRNYLTQLQRATAEGVPVRGYFLWSLLDNFEWADGYATRFGLIHVDYKTQKRTPKLSASFFREVIARNAVA